MLKQWALGLVALAVASVGMAAGFGAEDAGVYEIVKLQDNKPASLSGIQMRLHQKNGQWSMEGKDSSIQGANKGKWLPVCTAANQCSFTTSSPAQLKAMFPQWAQMSKTDDIGCIQNQIQAFCRLDSKSQKGYTAYMMVVVNAKPPVQMILQRQQ